MPKQYYIINAQAESTACLDAVYSAHMSSHTSPPDYVAETVRWDVEQTRLTDGKYIVRVCEHYTNINNYPIEESQDDWFPSEEI